MKIGIVVVSLSLKPVIKDGWVGFALVGFTPVTMFDWGSFRFLMWRTCGLVQSCCRVPSHLDWPSGTLPVPDSTYR